MTFKANRWQLPEGVDEVLPPRAQQLETLRREVLDLYQRWGYTIIKTPLIEFLESLHIVPSQELALNTFTLVDQLSGRAMGVRSDITSQAARIDAHVLQRNAPTRLCYADMVLLTLPNGPLGSRSPRLVGAELYGHSGIDSDFEVIGLMLHTLQVVGIEQALLALGHSNICRTLLQQAQLPAATETALFEALQNKATTDIARVLAQANLPAALSSALTLLPTLHGDPSVLATARQVLNIGNDKITAALVQLEQLIALLQQHFPQQRLYVDLCELRGYDYHNGVSFSAYVEGHGQAIAKGGRYDGIGAAFGRARPATGFDADLLTLLSLSKRQFATTANIYAPAGAEPSLLSAIQSLRAQGRCVVQGLSGTAWSAQELGCAEQLVVRGGAWQVEVVN
jgi:ATP phosphoribosyltransferase regulatory subunit